MFLIQPNEHLKNGVTSTCETKAILRNPNGFFSRKKKSATPPMISMENCKGRVKSLEFQWSFMPKFDEKGGFPGGLMQTSACKISRNSMR